MDDAGQERRIGGCGIAARAQSIERADALEYDQRGVYGKSACAVQFLPGSLSIPEVVTILHGSDYNRILGATDAGSLVVRATEKGIEFVMKRLPGTQPGKDVSRLIKDRLLKSFRAGYVAEEVEASTVNIMGLEFQLETVKSGILCEIRLSSAPMAAGALNRRYRHLEGLF